MAFNILYFIEIDALAKLQDLKFRALLMIEHSNYCHELQDGCVAESSLLQALKRQICIAI